MTVHVGQLTSQVEVQSGDGAVAPGKPGASGASLTPTWAERERHRRLVEDERRRVGRLAEERFDG